VASASVPLRNRFQTDVAIARDLRQLGDSHNPDDPHFAAFKQSVLDRYGVATVEDLPVNYKGVVAVEGERMTSSLFNLYAANSFAAQERQNGLVDVVALASPAMALRSMSMAAAGTDLAGHRRFVEQAEAFRYALVQRLNQLQAEAVSYADDTAEDAGADRRKRIAADNWRAAPDFHFAAPTGATLAAQAMPPLAIVLGWLALAAALLAVATRRLEAR
jgi:ABC-2 type transport system permease protein